MAGEITYETREYEHVTLKITPTREMMGVVAAEEAGYALRELLDQYDHINVMFAAAPSQLEFLRTLADVPDIDWSRVHAFHMDEYIGLPDDSEASFRHFLDQAFFKKLPLGKVYYINDAPVAKRLENYTKLLEQNPLDIVFMGIGENGHIAFNDPPIADFKDTEIFKKVALDEMSRQQQVHDKTFPNLDAVPTEAFTVTIPPMLAAKRRFCIVPSKLKAEAIRQALEGPISTDCPASILRTVPTEMYIDEAAASLLGSRS